MSARQAVAHILIERHNRATYHRVYNQATLDRLYKVIQEGPMYDKAIGLGFDWVYQVPGAREWIEDKSKRAIISIKFPNF